MVFGIGSMVVVGPAAEPTVKPVESRTGLIKAPAETRALFLLCTCAVEQKVNCLLTKTIKVNIAPTARSQWNEQGARK